MKTSSWVKHLHRQAPDVEVRLWPNAGQVADIRMVLVWKHPAGVLNRFPNLGCIASLGVGVDHVLSDRRLPEKVPITRVVDPSMAKSMSEYVVAAVLGRCRQLERYRQDQAKRKWRPRVPQLASKTRIGIMGLGQLGAFAAARLGEFDFPVAGWSRSPKDIARVESYVGSRGLTPFLARTDILICMLPLTPSTEGILNEDTFARLPEGAYLVNVARGQHLVEQDLLAALDSGRLSGACLDVFHQEPLPGTHPFWTHPRITVTPHISSLTYPAAVVPQLIENYRRLEKNEPLVNVVDRKRGY